MRYAEWSGVVELIDQYGDRHLADGHFKFKVNDDVYSMQSYNFQIIKHEKRRTDTITFNHHWIENVTDMVSNEQVDYLFNKYIVKKGL